MIHGNVITGVIGCLIAGIGVVILLQLLRIVARKQIGSYLKRNQLFLLYMNHGGYGDAACMTGLMQCIHAANPVIRFVVICRYPDFFKYNPLVFKFIGSATWRKSTMHRLTKLLRWLKLPDSHLFAYEAKELGRGPDFDPEQQRPHLIQLGGEGIPLAVDYQEIKNYIPLQPEEINRALSKFGIQQPYALIAPVGKNGFSGNKEWGFDKFQEVVHLLPKVNWVQTGEESSPKLTGALDLRGKTTLRDLCALIAGSEFVFSIEGMHNHIASAYDKVSFVIISGFHYAELVRYPFSVPIILDQRLECSPCWENQPCPIGGKPCLTGILPKHAAKIIAGHQAYGVFTGITHPSCE